MIRIENVTKRFGRAAAAVAGVSLDLSPGESVALWGVNGAGKSTLIRCVLGLYRFEGRIRVGSHDVARDGKAARMLVGYVPQELGFHDELGVAEAIAHFARLKGIARLNARDALAGVGLDGHERKRVRELSGGMKQRLALAIALLGDPPVLVLDEVTASLDACGRDAFVALLAGLSGSGRTMLFASHRPEEVRALARRVVVLDRGRVASEATTSGFLEAGAGSTLLHLVLDPSIREHALALLRERGYEPKLNGTGIKVPVTAAGKADPIRVLAEARVEVRDFEVLRVPATREEVTP